MTATVLELDQEPAIVERAHDDGVNPPAWLCTVAFAAAAGVLAFGAMGLILAINGWYRLLFAFPLGAVGTVGLVLLVRPQLRTGAAGGRSRHVAAAVGLAAIATITLWNSAHASQHVLINRDPGAYTTAGRWIARSGELEVQPRVGPFADERLLSFESPGLYDMPNGTLEFQFAHLLPVLLAEAHDVGADFLLFHLPVLLSGVALLAFFVLAWRLLLRPWFALGATLAFAFVLPQVWFSRDSYSEIPHQILLFTAIWLLASRRLLPDPRVALGAGLFLGVSEAVRVDALAHVLGVPVLLAIWWLAREEFERRPGDAIRASGAFLVGLSSGLALAFVDLSRHSGDYVTDLSGQLRQLGLAISVSALVVVTVVIGWPRLRRVLRQDRIRVVANSAAIAVTVVGFAAWIVRPAVQTVRGNDLLAVRVIQVLEAQPIDGTRRYFENSLTWMNWYLGPLTVTAAIIGAALLVRALVLSRYLRVIPAVCLLVPATSVYLWKADAVPDHVWVARRFLTSTIPVLVLLAFGVAAVAWTHRSRRVTSLLLRASAIVFVFVAIAYPISTVRPVAAMSEQRGFVLALRDACRVLGPRAAVVIFRSPTDRYVDLRAPQSLRSWCGAEVAAMRSEQDAPTLHRLSREWAAAGRPLFVVAGRAQTIRSVFPNATIASTRVAVNRNLLEATLTRRPSRLQGQSFAIYLARVPE